MVLALVIAGCGGRVVVDTGTAAGDLTCAELCMKVPTSCSGQTSATCATSCPLLEKLGATCPGAYQAYLTCVDAHPDVLCGSVNTACNVEMMPFAQCLTKACTADPTKCKP